MKQCGNCKVEKPITEFYTRPRGDLSWECKSCTKVRGKAHQENLKLTDPIKFERQKANRYLKSTYGLTLEEYEVMFLSQDGKCAICKEEQQDGIRLCVDHDHSCCPGNKSCGKCIRKLLCTRCNTTLGKVNEDVAILESMIDYIKKG